MDVKQIMQSAWESGAIKRAKAEAYQDAVSLIDTLIKNCNPTEEQLSALERARGVIRARLAGK